MEETPAKVMSLLGISLVSMAFLFSVTLTDASFQGTHMQLPNPFAPEKVVAMVDTAANSYSSILHAYVIDSGAKDYAMAADNLAWIGSNAKDGAVAMLGLDQIHQSQQVQMTAVAQAAPVQGQVAGAYTNTPYQNHSVFSVDSLMSALGME